MWFRLADFTVFIAIRPRAVAFHHVLASPIVNIWTDSFGQRISPSFNIFSGRLDGIIAGIDSQAWEYATQIAPEPVAPRPVYQQFPRLVAHFH